MRSFARALALATLLFTVGGAIFPARPIKSDGLTRVTSYFCPPNCGAEAWTGNPPVPGWTAACAQAHALTYAHLSSYGEVFCGDYGARWYFERGDEPVDVYGVYLGTDYDYVWYSDYP